MGADHSSFSDFYTVQNVIFVSHPGYKTSYWPIQSCGLLLDAVDVGEVFKVFIWVVFIFHQGFDLFSNFFLYLGILSYIVDHSINIMRSSISACDEECAELFKNLLVWVEIFVSRLGNSTSSDKCFNDIIRRPINPLIFNFVFNLVHFSFNVS